MSIAAQNEVVSSIKKMESFLKRNKRRVPSFAKKLRVWLFFLLKPFLVKKYQKYYESRIQALDSNTQLFFVGRNDYGTILNLVNYASLWSKTRTKAAIAIFSTDLLRVHEIAKTICPDIELIYPDTPSQAWPLSLFGTNLVFSQIMPEIYPSIAIVKREALELHYTFCCEATGTTDYHSEFDPALEQFRKQFSPEFLQAYQWMRTRASLQWAPMTDYFKLGVCNKEPNFSFKSSVLDSLNCKRQFVLLNVNTKDYNSSASNERAISDWQRYNVVIDFLIEKGFAVVLQGRQEQPQFQKREHLHDYSKSSVASIQGDIELFSRAEFAIMSKTGPEVYGSICDTPTLTLNYTEFAGNYPIRRARFFPKHLRHRETKERLSWKEYLFQPLFFARGCNTFGIEDYAYEEMEEGELVDSVREFLPLLASKDEWELSESQQQFRNTLTPLHLKLFLSKSCPLDCYLQQY